MRSSICSGNQIRISKGADTSVTIQKPLGIGRAAKYATATTTRDSVRERLNVMERLRAKFRAEPSQPDWDRGRAAFLRARSLERLARVPGRSVHTRISRHATPNRVQR